MIFLKTSDETIIDHNRIIVAIHVTSATIDSDAGKSMSLNLLPVVLSISILRDIAFIFHLQLFNIQSFHTILTKSEEK